MKPYYTIREVYEEGAALLEILEDARLDARLLLEHFCRIPTHRLLSDPEDPVEPAAREAFLEGIRRRAAREPLAYIVGEQSFMGLPFVVSPDVLIPEQDTENLVEEALRFLEDGSRILDLCTGSGCILLSLLNYTNGCVGVGTDISPQALEIARKNAKALGLEDRSAWLQGDLFGALDGWAGEDPFTGSRMAYRRGKLPGEESGWAGEDAFRDDRPEGLTGPAGMKFDLIISNPPYIPSEVIGTLAPEVSHAQPRLALDGGTDGLDFYRRIISQAPAHLVIGGRLMMEIGYDQADAVTDLLDRAGYYGIEIIRDYGGNDRIATAVRSALRQ